MVIKEAGKVVARLIPAIEPPQWIVQEPGLLRLWLDGALTLPTSADTAPPPSLPGVSVPLEQLMKDLDADRADRW